MGIEPDNTNRPPEQLTEDEKWITNATKIPAIALLGVVGAMIAATGAVLVGGILALSPEQKAEIVKQTVDAIPAIVVASIGIVTSIAGGIFYLDRRDARKQRNQENPPIRNPN
ncbi:MAG TPA: hypothetical protein VF189_06685 [Patescibacteria group bacterium]